MTPAFRYAPAQWASSPHVHLVWNVVTERSSKFAECGAKIGDNAVYDSIRGKSVYDSTPLVPSCPQCVRHVVRAATEKQDDAALALLRDFPSLQVQP